MTHAVSNAFGSSSGSNLVRIIVDYDYTTNSTGRYYTYTVYLELLKGWFNWNGTGSRFYCSWIPGEILVKGQAEGIGSKWGTKSFSKQANFGNTFVELLFCSISSEFCIVEAFQRTIVCTLDKMV